jgi:hypothetical protein
VVNKYIIQSKTAVYFFTMTSSPFRVQASYSVPWSFFTDGRTPWTSDQPVARLLPKHTTTQKQNKHIHTSNIHALSGIPTHEPSVRASEVSSCLRPRGYCDRQNPVYSHSILRDNMFCTYRDHVLSVLSRSDLSISPTTRTQDGEYKKSALNLDGTCS